MLLAEDDCCMPDATTAAAMPLLALDSLTLTDTDPGDLIRSAHQAGFDLVSLWLTSPSVYPKQRVTPDVVEECCDLLDETGLRVHAIEAFDLTSPEEMLAARPVIELAAHLGAKALVAMNLFNRDRGQVIDALRQLSAVAADHGLGVNIEPLAMGRTRTLAAARDLIGDAGVDAGIIFDAYNFTRAGEPIEAITAIDPGLIRYVQMCDAPASTPRDQWGIEACEARLHPGEGDFALVDMARLLPRNVPWAAEIPRLSWSKAGVPPRVQASAATDSLRDLLASL